MKVLSGFIKKRISCRTYADRPLEDKVMSELSGHINAAHIGPFGNKPTFKLIQMDNLTPQEWKKLGTYGVIKNARYFLAGTIKNTPLAMEDYGYCKEMLILNATALGLGTCWMGGTFQASGFAKAAGIRKGEILPTVSPLGYPADEKSLTEKIMRRFAGSDHRKPWNDVFFANNLDTPLTQAQAGKYRDALENLRLAPSASNKQPWRILYDAKLNTFHFFLERSLQYKMLGIVHLQDIDMGIAMSHFEITARDQGLAGSWKVTPDHPKYASLDYIVSWLSEN